MEWLPFVGRVCDNLKYPFAPQKMTLHHEKMTLHHEKMTLHHEKMTLHHEKITLHHEKMTLHHEKITLHHEKITLHHEKNHSAILCIAMTNDAFGLICYPVMRQSNCAIFNHNSFF
jgi:hypothetical protein